LRSWNPLWANLQIYRGLWLDSWRTNAWADKLRVWCKPPGWRPADVAARWPQAAFDIATVQRFDPPLRGRVAWGATLLFLLALNGATLLLWHAHQLDLPTQLWCAVAIVGTLVAVGVMTQRPHAT
jgi:hypothetical protein